MSICVVPLTAAPVSKLQGVLKNMTIWKPPFIFFIISEAKELQMVYHRKNDGNSDFIGYKGHPVKYNLNYMIFIKK